MTKANGAEALHSITVPLAYYEWLAKIEKDVCVHDLTPHEQADLIAALSAPTRERESATKQNLLLKPPCRLDEAPIGLFLCCGELCVKTEYREPNGAVSSFIVESGEFFWGPSPQTVENQNACTVTPCRIDNLLNEGSGQ